MPRTQVTATIPAGQSLSNTIDIRSGAPVLIYLPTAWTSARLTYCLSYDGTTFRDLYDRYAKEIAVNIRPGTVVRPNPEWTEAALGGYLKLRSGSADMPIAQAADRVFTITIDTGVSTQLLPAPPQ